MLLIFSYFFALADLTSNFHYLYLVFLGQRIFNWIQYKTVSLVKPIRYNDSQL